ncbi:MAG: methyltransferase domain-containing protein [Euryarchaeota archaeon]|nr:methyltransferase domain-containing protein [Euryarchaeota archaeon]MDE1835623.1 methyltransferase domain-containing protein [Euryarchaeota archaeon]MDE1878971.1 methyltransferase domain-containing protein [Euryarchaeota archaeon]MDE2043755.1 methyltransferase domain-containing protein [Thermoplasmata archaeon]
MPEFDLVAPLYDATRRPPSPAELGAVAEALQTCTEVLEAGVGTGRFAKPLSDRGFHLTGVDISREMLKRAGEKGLPRLLQADVHRLPFRDGAFEASLIIHVLQLIPEPARALEELARVARERVVAHLPDHRSGGLALRGELLQRYGEIAAEMGHPLPPRRRFWENTERVLRDLPPERVFVVEEDISPPTDPEMRWRDLRGFGGLITVPPEMHERIVARLLEEGRGDELPLGPRTRTLRVAVWETSGLRQLMKNRSERRNGGLRF